MKSRVYLTSTPNSYVLLCVNRHRILVNQLHRPIHSHRLVDLYIFPTILSYYYLVIFNTCLYSSLRDLTTIYLNFYISIYSNKYKYISLFSFLHAFNLSFSSIEHTRHILHPSDTSYLCYAANCWCNLCLMCLIWWHFCLLDTRKYIYKNTTTINYNQLLLRRLATTITTTNNNKHEYRRRSSNFVQIRFEICLHKQPTVQGTIYHSVIT